MEYKNITRIILTREELLRILDASGTVEVPKGVPDIRVTFSGQLELEWFGIPEDKA